MSLVEHIETFIFSSDPANGSINLSPDGSTFQVQLDHPIGLPKETVFAKIETVGATIWYTTPNISVEKKNNTIDIFSLWEDPVTGVPAGSPNFQIVFADGLYGLQELNSALGRELANLGLPSNLIVISGDTATQQSILTYNNDGFQTFSDFTQANSIRTILGFDSRESPLLADQSTPGYSDKSDDIAAFNTISNFQINTDLIMRGIPVNNVMGGVIANIPITIGPGSLLNFIPFLPPTVNASDLIGKMRNTFSMRLTDQNGNNVDTKGEYWSVELRLVYMIPYHRQRGLDGMYNAGNM